MVHDAEKTATRESIIIAVVGYSVCSASLLLINKVCIYLIPAPSMIMVMQLAFSSLFVLYLKYSGTAVVDDFEWDKLKPYMAYIVAFAFGVYANVRALQASNVETVIVFRACSPLLVAVMDYALLGRQLPSPRSWGALSLLILGAVGYVVADSQFAMLGVPAYTWGIVYFFIICFEMTYGKMIIKDVKMDSIWGSVLYTNVLGAPPMMVFCLLSGELSNVSAEVFTPGALLLVLVSCIVGTGISYAGWHCRSMISATSYTLVGVLNKLATVLANCLIWDQHATSMGILSLLVCLGGGALYRQAPLREVRDSLP